MESKLFSNCNRLHLLHLTNLSFPFGIGVFFVLEDLGGVRPRKWLDDVAVEGSEPARDRGVLGAVGAGDGEDPRARRRPGQGAPYASLSLYEMLATTHLAWSEAAW